MVPKNHNNAFVNHLAKEKSPYLLQHANNPVDWYPWSDEAFKKAISENKPIFLSIGYSTCHWCHVMAHESFEDPEVAKILNEGFVSIKVDREERPDIDKVYMMVCQITTGSGGWPLTIMMTPEKKPFFAGTYFPKTSQYGRIGLIDLLNRIKNLWDSQKAQVLDAAHQITFDLQNFTGESPGDKLDQRTLRKGYEQLKKSFNSKNGGFGSAPKFPTPHNLLFLLRYWNHTGDKESLEMVEKTLNAMKKGGIYDHIGYGFHRYSTDSEWLVPHFEKMLYDQALTAMAYSEAFQATQNEEYAEVAREIFEYILRDMASNEGGFYSAEDADSEGVEGKFYLWSKEEIISILGEKDASWVSELFTVKEEGNYLDEATKEKQEGKNILHFNESYENLASNMNIPISEFKNTLKKAKEKLFLHREMRIHPHKDDKILTDWNGLMIAALAKGARTLKELRYQEAAEKAVEFLLTRCVSKDGALLHRYRGGSAEINAFLDDFVFLIWGLIELYEATFKVKYVKLALELNEKLTKGFWDANMGGYYFTAGDSESLIARQKEVYDGATPSGNSVQYYNLIRLSHLTGSIEFSEKAELLARVFSESVNNNPIAYTFLLLGLDLELGPTYSVVISGDTDKEDTILMLQALNGPYLPNMMVIHRQTETRPPVIDKFSNFIELYGQVDNKATAYVCINKTCKPPTTEANKMLEYILLK